MIFCEVAGLNSKFRILFLIDLQSVLVKLSTLFIINTKTSERSSLSVGVCYMCYIYLSQSSRNDVTL